MKAYTFSDDSVLCAGWPDVRRIAATLDRTLIAVKARGRKLGLPCPSGRPKRPFTNAERQMVFDRYPSEGAKPLAQAMGRTQADIVSLAQRLDVRFDGLRRWTEAEDARLAEMRRAGRTAIAIAAALDRTVTAVGKRAIALGLSTPTYDLQARWRSLAKPRVVTRSGCEVRWARARLALGEHGWPPDLNPKEIAILESLLARGPQTRLVLSRSVGEPASRHRHKRLMTHGGRSAMARLLARGLVARCFLNDGRKRTTIYALTRSAEQRRGTFPSVESFNAPIAARGRGAAVPAACSRLEKAS